MQPFDIPLTLIRHTSTVRNDEPVTVGVPFPKGSLQSSDQIGLLDPAGLPLSLQVRALDHWSDGSVRWLLCDFQVTTSGTQTIRIASDRCLAWVPPPLARIALAENDVRSALQSFGAVLLSSDALTIVDLAGKRFECLPDFDWFIEDLGLVRGCVRESGTLTRNDTHFARYTLRTHYFANSPVVRVHLTITNPNRSEHPGGCWNLGERGSILIRDASVRFSLSGGGRTSCRMSVETDGPFMPIDETVEVFQASSGGANWRSTNHLSRARTVAADFRGYRLRTDVTEDVGIQATPIVAISREDRHLAISMPEFWQNFPKAIEADRKARLCVCFRGSRSSPTSSRAVSRRRTSSTSRSAGTPSPTSRSPGRATRSSRSWTPSGSRRRGRFPTSRRKLATRTSSISD